MLDITRLPHLRDGEKTPIYRAWCRPPRDFFASIIVSSMAKPVDKKPGVSGSEPPPQYSFHRRSGEYSLCHTASVRLGAGTMEDTPRCNTCSMHPLLLARIENLESIVGVIKELKGVVVTLTEQVCTLSHNVERLRHEQRAFIPWYLKLAVTVPSIVVTVAGSIWVVEHALK